MPDAKATVFWVALVGGLFGLFLIVFTEKDVALTSKEIPVFLDLAQPERPPGSRCQFDDSEGTCLHVGTLYFQHDVSFHYDDSTKLTTIFVPEQLDAVIDDGVLVLQIDLKNDDFRIQPKDEVEIHLTDDEQEVVLSIESQKKVSGKHMLVFEYSSPRPVKLADAVAVEAEVESPAVFMLFNASQWEVLLAIGGFLLALSTKLIPAGVTGGSGRRRLRRSPRES